MIIENDATIFSESEEFAIKWYHKSATINIAADLWYGFEILVPQKKEGKKKYLEKKKKKKEKTKQKKKEERRLHHQV